MDFAQINEFIVTNWVLFLALVIIIALLARSWISTGGLPTVSPMQAVQMLNRGANVLDIRIDKEFEQGHILGARHIPLGLLENRLHELTEHKDADWVLVCQNGSRSAQAGAILKKQGFSKLHALSGGVDAWRNGNLPLSSGKGKKGGKKHD